MVVSVIYFLYILTLPINENIQWNEIEQPFTQIEEREVNSGSQQITSTIIEVEGDPKKHQAYITTYFPTIEIVAVYTKLFNGLALKGRPSKMMRLMELDFVKGVYPVQTYTTQLNLLESYFDSVPLLPQYANMRFASNASNAVQSSKWTESNRNRNQESIHMNKLLSESIDVKNAVLPNELNNTKYTGKGIKVGVIDTGIDYNHRDLKKNYRGGFDVVDLDDKPMETTERQGIPTNHGTHVAGIIAANGELKGVAPDAEIFAYRALGPGGFGTSIQVIAAMEEAVKDGVDIINLSLGNTINGPDYPTSRAVNEARKLGVIVVVANGNAGPNDWTIGAPATSPGAFSVGAYQQSEEMPYLYEPRSGEIIPLMPVTFSKPWNLTRDYRIVLGEKATSENFEVRDKIGVFKQEDTILSKQVTSFADNGGAAVIIYGVTAQNQHLVTMLKELNISIPIAQVTMKDGRWLEKTAKERPNLYFKNKIKKSEPSIAHFSSRGPVTVNWMIKPDVIAPGVNIVSTVPGGYEKLNGTSMAAPHVAGAIAVVKEAKPTWTNEQVLGALKTTASKIKENNKQLVAPITQGAGLIDMDAAINTTTIIRDVLLSFGKIGTHVEERTIELTIENLSEQSQTYSFDYPKRKRGYSWQLPSTFTIEGKSTKTIPVTIKVNTLQLAEGAYQGWLTLKSGDDSYALPYLFISETANYPRIMGFTFQANQKDKKTYTYQFYAAERVERIQIQLFEPNSLVHVGTLMTLTDLKIGMNEGFVRKDRITQRGRFHGIILVHLESGKLLNYATEIIIE